MNFSNKVELYKPFFLLSKIVSVIDCLIVCKLASSMIGLVPSNSIVIPMYVSAILWMAAQIVAAHFAEKMINENNSLGLIIGVFLAFMNLPSLFFPVGFFGLYAFFNKAFREEKFTNDRPLWLASIYEQVEKWSTPKKA